MEDALQQARDIAQMTLWGILHIHQISSRRFCFKILQSAMYYLKNYLNNAEPAAEEFQIVPEL